MKDQRFLPIEKHNPVDDAEEYSDGSEDLLIGSDSESAELHGKKSVSTLYIAS